MCQALNPVTGQAHQAPTGVVPALPELTVQMGAPSLYRVVCVGVGTVLTGLARLGEGHLSRPGHEMVPPEKRWHPTGTQGMGRRELVESGEKGVLGRVGDSVGAQGGSGDAQENGEVRPQPGEGRHEAQQEPETT